MEHVVFFPSPDGSDAFRRVPSLEEAVRLVEHLRNVEGIDHVSCHALVDVPLAFRAYYRVEVDATPPSYDEPQVQAPYVEAEQVESAVQVGSAEQDREPVAVGAQASADAQRPAGANSLGFFA